MIREEACLCVFNLNLLDDKSGCKSREKFATEPVSLREEANALAVI